MPRKHKSSGPAAPVPLAGPQRLNKLLAAAGLGSRREVEQYILEGRIEIDGQPVTDLATKVDPETTQLTFDGSAIKIFRPVYFALNKPVGVLSTNRDPSGRMRAIDLINVKERIFSAGRLDRSSEGLMLLTNDGELAQRLSHPRYGIQKLYLATVQGEVTQADLEKLIRGVRLAEGYAKVDAVKLRKQRSGAADLEIALSEGKNREIRRILARLGHKVVGLKRLAIGPLRLGQLPTGGWRPLTKHEIQALYAAATTGRRKKRGTGKPLRKPRTGDEDAAAPVMAAGQFDRYNDDEDDFGPSLDEIDGDGDEEMIVLGDDSLSGTVIPYDDDDVVDDDGGSMEDMFGDEEDEDDDFEDDEIGDEDEEPVRRSPTPRGSREQSSTRSPHDLRNRNRATGTGRGERSGYQGSRGSRPSGSAPRGAKKSSSRPASSSGPRSGAPRSGGSRTSSRPGSSGPRAGAPRSGAPRSSSAPRSSTGPRSGSSTGGRPAQGGAGRSAPSRSGPSRSSTGPSRGGAGRSGPGRSSGQGGAGRSGPGSSSGPRSGPSRGGPNRGGGQSGPSRGGSSGPSRGGPRSGGSGRGGPGRGGPGKGRGGGGGKR